MWKEITKENKWWILKHFWFVWQIILVNGTNFTHAITQFRSNKKKNFIIMMTKLYKQKQAIKTFGNFKFKSVVVFLLSSESWNVTEQWLLSFTFSHFYFSSSVSSSLRIFPWENVKKYIATNFVFDVFLHLRRNSLCFLLYW